MIQVVSNCGLEYLNKMKDKMKPSFCLFLDRIEGLETMYEKTIDSIRLLIKDGIIPGASFSFINQNETMRHYMGNKQMAPYIERLKEETLYDMASLTKVIGTNTVLLKMKEEGLIDWDDALSQHLPEWQDTTVTLRHLLTHTSDINPFIPRRNELSKSELRQAVLSLSSGDKRGLEVVYTDIGTVLLGFMIEHSYQQPVQKVIEEQVLIPLGMKNSTFSPSNPKDVAPTEYRKDRGMIQGEVHDPKAFILQETCGSAGLFSTLCDTEKFVQMMLQQGKTEETFYLKASTIMSLLQDYTPLGNQGRSLGWDIKYNNHNGVPMLFHTGYTGTFILMDIVNREAFIFLSNRVHPMDNRIEYLEKRDEMISIYLNEKT